MKTRGHYVVILLVVLVVVLLGFLFSHWPTDGRSTGVRSTGVRSTGVWKPNFGGGLCQVKNICLRYPVAAGVLVFFHPYVACRPKLAERRQYGIPPLLPLGGQVLGRHAPAIFVG
ncbi:MAG: hypothetical protein PHR30_08475 [Gallionellaceae bacterium]|nr:hypothetical protein [Gallionellaceae bacterium]